MPFLDKAAGNKLVELREELIGLSPESVAHAITKRALSADWKNGTVDAFTIRRAERGFVPALRCRFVIAQFYGLQPHDIWSKDVWVKVDGKGRPIPA